MLSGVRPRGRRCQRTERREERLPTISWYSSPLPLTDQFRKTSSHLPDFCPDTWYQQSPLLL